MATKKGPAVSGGALSSPTNRSEAEAAGDSVGARLGEEAREDLVRRRERRSAEIGDVRAAVGAEERRVERDLLIILVEQVLRPDLERPALLGAANADAGVGDEEAVLLLLGEQVGAGIIVLGQASVEIDQARSCPNCRSAESR